MDGVCPRNDVWQTAFVRCVVVLVHRLVMAVGEDCQPATFGLNSERASPRSFLVDRNGEGRGVIRV